MRFHIHDRETTFDGYFDEVFASEGVHVTRTSDRSPNANAFGERWIGTATAECLDWILILWQPAPRASAA